MLSSSRVRGNIGTQVRFLGEERFAFVLGYVEEENSGHARRDDVVVGVRPGVEDDSLESALGAVNEAVVYVDIVDDQQTSFLTEFDTSSETLEGGFVKLHPCVLRNALVNCVDGHDWLLVLASQSTQEHAVVILTVVVRVARRRTAEVHEHRGGFESVAVAESSFRAFEIAEPVVVLD